MVGNKTILNPIYSFSCHPILPEREVAEPWQRWSNFYDFGMWRKIINVLEVRDLTDSDKAPYYELEILPTGKHTQLWIMSDGWLYKLESEFRLRNAMERIV